MEVALTEAYTQTLRELVESQEDATAQASASGNGPAGRGAHRGWFHGHHR